MSDDGPYVFESRFVDALMKTGISAIDLDRQVQENTGEKDAFFGKGSPDFVGGPIDPESVRSLRESIASRGDVDWNTACRLTLLEVQGSQSIEQLKDNLYTLSATVIAWITDIEKRTPIGVDK